MMGSSFFKNKGTPISGGNPGLEARAIGSIGYGARSAAGGAAKTLGVAQGINNAAIKSHGALKRSAAYPKGPKI